MKILNNYKGKRLTSLSSLTPAKNYAAQSAEARNGIRTNSPNFILIVLLLLLLSVI
jgi:hypothetical protein